MKILFHDTETTGIGPEDRILQSAYALFEVDDKSFTLISYMEEYINPEMDINPAAAAVHGIWYDETEGAPSFIESDTKKDLEEFIKDRVFYCAHNAQFDIEMLKKEGLNYPDELIIDTLSIAKKVNQGSELESNSLQYMRYYFDFDRNPDFKKFLKQFKSVKKLQAHTALSDIVVLAFYFKKLFEEKVFNSVEEASKISQQFTLEKQVKFGNAFEKGADLYKAIIGSYKQYGKTKKGIEYFNWAIKNMDSLSADMRLSISHWTIEGIKAGHLSIFDKNVQPMLYIAAAFLPEHRGFIEQNGLNPVLMGKAVVSSIESELEKSDIDDNKRRILSSMLKYYKEF